MHPRLWPFRRRARAAVALSLLATLGALAGAIPACSRDPAAVNQAPAKPDPAARAGVRVAALGPALADMFSDQGGLDLLVARHAFDTLHPGLPSAGDQSGIDYEALLRLRPSHVLLQWGQRDLPPRLQALAKEHAWSLESFPLLTLEEIQAAADRVNAIIAEARAGAAPPPPRIVQSLSALHADRAAVGPVLVLFGASPPTVLGPGSYHQQVLERLGATPAIREGQAFMTLDVEDVRRLDPRGIILIQPRDPGAAPAEDSPPLLRQRLGPLADLDIRAVREGRVALIDDPRALLPSTSLIAIARQMDAILRRWASAPPG